MNKSKMTVTMSVEDYEELECGYNGRNIYIKMFERANEAMVKNNGIPILTDELKTTIEEIHC